MAVFSLVLVRVELLPTSILIVYPTWVRLLVTVSVQKILHQFGGSRYAMMVYLPEHHAPILPTAHAIHPQCLLQPCPLFIVPRKMFQPIDEERLVATDLHRAPDIRPRYLHHRQRCWFRSWWRWRVVQRYVVDWLVVLLTKPTDSIWKTEPFVLHKELHRTAFLVADETAISVAMSRLWDARWPHDEVAVCPIVVERAQAGEVHACLAEVYEVAHDILNLRTVNDSLYYFVWYLWHNA